MTLGNQFDKLRNEPRMDEYELAPDRAKRAIENMRERKFDVTRGTHGTVWHPDVDVILPGEKVGKTNFEQTSRVNRAYYTAHHTELGPTMAEAAGWRWARTAAERSIEYDPDTHAVDPSIKVRKRPVVHEVEAGGHLAGDPVLNPDGKYDKELTADYLRVKDTHWVPTVLNDYNYSTVANQGTFPGHNWNRWGDPEHPGKEYNVHEVKQESQFKKANKEWAESRSRPAPKKELPGQTSLPIGGGVVYPTTQQSPEDWALERLREGYRFYRF